MSDGNDTHPDALDSLELIETLASIEHERWSNWQGYMHGKCVPNDDGSLTIPRELVERWAQQMSTPYGALPEDQRASDREQVQLYLPTIKQALAAGINHGQSG